MKIDVLYEDNHLIAVYKPAGVLVQGDATGVESLMDFVKAHIKEEHKKPGNVFLGLVQRLDRPASGIVVFAKTSKGAARISEQIREHTVHKTYHALVSGQLTKKKDSLINYLSKDEKNKRAIITDQPAPGFDESELQYEVLSSNGTVSLVRVHLITGRFHQIRAQMSHIGHPIIGDTKYGGPVNEVLGKQTIALCATGLRFTTATGEKTVNLSIKIPGEWDLILKS